MVNDADYNIVARFGAEYRGIVQYYLLAGDVFRLHRLRWVMETSMLKTLAASIARRCRRWRPAQGQNRDTARAAHAASRPVSNAQAGNHWSPGSAASHSNGRRTRSSPTADTPGRSTRTGSWSPGC